MLLHEHTEQQAIAFKLLMMDTTNRIINSNQLLYDLSNNRYFCITNNYGL